MKYKPKTRKIPRGLLLEAQLKGLKLWPSRAVGRAIFTSVLFSLGQSYKSEVTHTEREETSSFGLKILKRNMITVLKKLTNAYFTKVKGGLVFRTANSYKNIRKLTAFTATQNLSFPLRIAQTASNMFITLTLTQKSTEP